MSNRDLGQMVVRIIGDNSDLNKSIDASKQKMEAFKSTALALGGSLSIGVTAPLVAMFAAAVKSTASMEMLQASFETMLGSAEKATALMTDLKKMAAITPFETTDLAQASKTLLQFGVSSEKLIPTLKMLGDASGGNSAKFSSMALVFGQISSMGKLMGQDLLQLINAGFNPLKEISDKTGESMASLKEKMSKGAISAQMVEEAFKSATSAGGKFYNGMDTASKTLDGLISTLKDDVATLGRSFIEDLLPFIKDVVKNLSAMAQKFSNLAPEVKAAILVMAALAAAIGPIILGIFGVIKAIEALKIVMALLSVQGGPIMAAVAAVGLLIGAIAMLVSQKNRLDLEALSKKFSLVADAAGVAVEKIQLIEKGFKSKFGSDEWIKSLGKVRDTTKWTVDDTINWIRELGITSTQYFAIAQASDNVTEAQKLGLIELQKQVTEQEKLYSTYQKMIDRKVWQKQAGEAAVALWRKNEADKLVAEKLAAENAKKASLERIAAILEGAKTEKQQVQDQIDGLEKIKNLTGKANDDRLAAIKILTAKLKKLNEEEKSAYNEKLNFAADAADKLMTLDEWVAKNEKKNRDIKREEAKKLKDDLITIGIDTYSALANIVSIFYNNSITAQKESLSESLRLNDLALDAALEAAGVQDETAVESAQKKLDAAMASNDAEKISEAEKALTKAKIEEEFAIKKLAIEKQGRQDAYKLELAAFRTNQAFAMGQIAISTAVAVAKVWEQTGIAGLIAQIGPIAMGVLQAATIMAQRPPSAPAFATGGIVMPKAGGTLGRLAEAGQPEVIFPLDDLNRFLNKPSTGNSSDGGMMSLVVNLDSRPILDKIFEATRNQTVLISQGAIV